MAVRESPAPPKTPTKRNRRPRPRRQWFVFLLPSRPYRRVRGRPVSRPTRPPSRVKGPSVSQRPHRPSLVRRRATSHRCQHPHSLRERRNHRNPTSHLRRWSADQRRHNLNPSRGQTVLTKVRRMSPLRQRNHRQNRRANPQQSGLVRCQSNRYRRRRRVSRYLSPTPRARNLSLHDPRVHSSDTRIWLVRWP